MEHYVETVLEQNMFLILKASSVFQNKLLILNGNHMVGGLNILSLKITLLEMYCKRTVENRTLVCKKI